MTANKTVAISAFILFLLIFACYPDSTELILPQTTGEELRSNIRTREVFQDGC